MTSSSESGARRLPAGPYIAGVVLLSRVVSLAQQTPAAAVAVLLFPFLAVIPSLLVPRDASRPALTTGVASAGAAFVVSSSYLGLLDGPRWWLRVFDFACAMLGAALLGFLAVRWRRESDAGT